MPSAAAAADIAHRGNVPRAVCKNGVSWWCRSPPPLQGNAVIVVCIAQQRSACRATDGVCSLSSPFPCRPPRGPRMPTRATFPATPHPPHAAIHGREMDHQGIPDLLAEQVSGQAARGWDTLWGAGWCSGNWGQCLRLGVLGKCMRLVAAVVPHCLGGSCPVLPCLSGSASLPFAPTLALGTALLPPMPPLPCCCFLPPFLLLPRRLRQKWDRVGGILEEGFTLDPEPVEADVLLAVGGAEPAGAAPASAAAAAAAAEGRPVDAAAGEAGGQAAAEATASKSEQGPAAVASPPAGEGEPAWRVRAGLADSLRMLPAVRWSSTQPLPREGHGSGLVWSGLTAVRLQRHGMGWGWAVGWQVPAALTLNCLPHR